MSVRRVPTSAQYRTAGRSGREPHAFGRSATIAAKSRS